MRSNQPPPPPVIVNLDRYPRQGPLYDRPIYPGNGYPANPGEDRPGLSAFGRLAKGGATGKSSILIYNGDSSRLVQPAAVPMLQLEGDDLDACQLCITLAPPRVIAIPFADLDGIAQQVLTGEQDNASVDTGNFPGTASPIAWPPLEAIIEWGVKGTAARAVVDFVNGVTVNVIASYLRVYAAVTQNEASGEISGTSAAYYLAAFVGPGWTKTGTAQRTVYVGTVDDADESDVFDVPKFARRAYLVGCDASVTPAVVAGFLRFWQSPDGQAGGNSTGTFFQNSNQPVAFDIPAGSAYFSVYNQSGVDMRMNVVFELAL